MGYEEFLCLLIRCVCDVRVRVRLVSSGQTKMAVVDRWWIVDECMQRCD